MPPTAQDGHPDIAGVAHGAGSKRLRNIVFKQTLVCEAK